MSRFLLLMLAGCSCGDPPLDTVVDPPALVGEGLFEAGCPQAGRAIARVIDSQDRLPGKAAVGTQGDVLIASTAAAFVITDVAGQSTYWYYGGALADAAVMSGCTPSEDKLDDVGFVLADLDLASVTSSSIRAFRAETVEVLNDGSDGGAAVVRATGTDDFHWLVEHTLINEAAGDGGRPMSDPFGTEVVIDYILDPDSPVLQVDVHVTNISDERFDLVEASLISYGETLQRYTAPSGSIELGGFSLASGMPWVLATDGVDALAWGIDNANLASLYLSGVNILVDLAQLTDGFVLDPGQTGTVTRYLAVGPGGPAAITALLDRTPSPLTDQPAKARTVTGFISSQGTPVDGTVRLEARSPIGDWNVMDRIDAPGEFSLTIPKFEAAWEFRLIAEHPGRDDSASVTVRPGNEVTLEIGPEGTLDYAIHDATGADLPGRLVLVRTDGKRVDHFLTGEGTVAVPPGTWDWTVTRGYEWSPATGTVTIPENGSGVLDAELIHVVDTTGWISVDTHVHSSDSPDSAVSQEGQLLRAAAHGLDIVVHTEHENIVDRRSVPQDAGLDPWVNNVIGEEVTAVNIEHMTLFPAVPDGSPRGGFVEWYGLDIVELTGEMRARSGGGVNLLNHPGYLDLIGWDRLTGGPTLTDPTLLAQDPGDPLWSWDFDGIEVMNGHGNIWINGNRRFDNWMSMVNHGHPMVAVGCSDDHGGNETGFPRTYVPHPSDAPAELVESELVAAFHRQQAIASAGGFARVDVDGAGPGELAVDTDTDGWIDLAVHLEALPEVDMTHFVVFANCDLIDSVLVTDPNGVEKYSDLVPLSLAEDTHLVVAAFGTTRLPIGLPQYDATTTARVLTSPIYVDMDGDGVFSAPGGRDCTYDIDVDVAY